MKHPLFSIIHTAAMCTYPVQPICTSVFILIFINPQYTVLHILSHCTSYSLFYFIICSYFHSHLYLYIYIFSCVMFHCFIAFYLFFVFYLVLIFLHFPLSGPVLTYISLLIIPCMIVYVTNNKEPWTLNLESIHVVDMWTLSVLGKQKLIDGSFMNIIWVYPCELLWDTFCWRTELSIILNTRFTVISDMRLCLWQMERGEKNYLKNVIKVQPTVEKTIKQHGAELVKHTVCDSEGGFKRL